VPSVAEKKSVPFTFVRFAGLDELVPLRISLTITVPAFVPSDFQSSIPDHVPVVPLLAAKNTVPLTSVIHGCVATRPPAFKVLLISLTITVPELVPSDVQSSCPIAVELLAEKNSRPLLRINPVPEDPVVPGNMSLTIVVPPEDPSVLQSSPFAAVPLAESAKKYAVLPEATS
jgi:hypothetical protein